MVNVPDAVTFRPHVLIRVSATACLSLLLLSAFGWYALPPELRAQFLLSQVVTLIAIVGLLVTCAVVLASSNVHADTNGLRIRNGFAVHRIEWDAVHKFLLRPGDPWGLVLIKPNDRPFEVDLDAEKRHLVGIQTADGKAARQAIDTLTAMQRRFGKAPAMPEHGD